MDRRVFIPIPVVGCKTWNVLGQLSLKVYEEAGNLVLAVLPYLKLKGSTPEERVMWFRSFVSAIER